MVYRGFRERMPPSSYQRSSRAGIPAHCPASARRTRQSLFAAELSLSELEVRVDSRHREEVRKIVKMLYQIEEQMRSLSHEVRPTVLDDLGLVPALEFLAAVYSSEKGSL